MDRKRITNFSGSYNFLSNFYPVSVWYDGARYPSVEHAFQAAKTFDKSLRKDIENARNAAEAKRLGGKVPLRKDWEQIKERVMFELVLQKFARRSMRIKLKETANAKLVEGNTWGDRYWGVSNGRGQNRLGEILMTVRTMVC